MPVFDMGDLTQQVPVALSRESAHTFESAWEWHWSICCVRALYSRYPWESQLQVWLEDVQVFFIYVQATPCWLLIFLKTIVKAESLSLVGAEFFCAAIHQNGSATFHDKHTLPHPTKHGQLQQCTIDSQLLYSPDWAWSPTYNADFIDTVVIVVGAV